MSRVAALEAGERSRMGTDNGGASQSGVPVVDALPAAGRLGRLVILASSGVLYRDSGASWVAIG